ncbi:MAG TPA: hypothetical protein DIT65_01480 [Cryomorphaceae bacterium]|nr:hypothetical protein [Cryomorphaceae bacterium]|tara:strand:- start:1842 stop:3488 length:1647 start_codon:yes stop_codon:yes gene_type:complete
MQKLIGALLGVLISITTFAQDPSKEGSSPLSALFYKAETYRITGRSELAKEAYAILLAQDPTHETALYQLARIFFTENNFFKAEQLLATGTSLYPENQWMWRLQAVNARQLGDMATALSSYEVLMVLHPDQPEYVQDALLSALAAGKSEKALILLNTLEELYGDGPEIVQQKMEIHLRNNDAKAAEKAVKQAIKDYPHRVEYRGLAAQFYDANDKAKKAEKILRTAVEDFPQNAPIAMELARVLQAKDKIDESIYYLERALVLPGMSLKDKGPVLISLWKTAKKDSSMQPMTDRAWTAAKEIHEGEGAYYLLEGERLILEGKFEQSVITYLKAIERGFNTPEVYTQVAELCRQTNQDDIALKVLRTMSREFSDNIEILSYVTFSHYDRGWWSECAKVAIESAPKALDGETQKWFYNLAGTAYFSQDSIESGVNAYELSLEIERDAAALNNLAWELGKRGLELERALALTKESNEKSTLEATYLDTWAWVLYKMGKYPEAQAKMVLALQLQRTAPDATLYKHASDIEKALGNQEKAQKYRDKAKELKGK